ncbi:MAG: hypothetical protein RIT27_451 [Pseudomonadota bacterium]|jgi:DNA helicase-2/ATP-dependent DNA helicase PcrA
MRELEKVAYLVESLNPQQREAVTSPAGNVLVLAGAGSGKTKVLTHRFAWLMEVEKISPQAILAVTFTNKAANEMRERLNKLLHLNPRNWWVGTFHGLAHRWLRQHWQEANLPQSFQILDSDDQLRIIKKILKESLKLDEKVWIPVQIQGYISRAKDQGFRPPYVETFDNYSRTMKMIYETYQQYCDQNGLVDFGELLLRVYELWHYNPNLLAYYQQRFPHILVDEFQDTNNIQYAWLQQLMGQTGYAFVVGDDDQSIYGWRGAKVGNVRRFQKDFSNVQLVRLEQNYRSTKTILAAANALIEKNNSRMGKKLWTEGHAGEPLRLFNAMDEKEEARFIGERIQQWVSQNKQHKDCAILYRSNAQSRILEETLIQLRLPYRIYGGLRFFERQEIKDALAYLRLLTNQNDDTSFERAIAVPPRGIGDVTMEKLREYARQHQVSLWQATDALVQEKRFFQNLKSQVNQPLSLLEDTENASLISHELNPRAINLLRNFLEMILTLRKTTAQIPLHQLVSAVLIQTGLLKFYQEKKGEKEQMRAENLQELINAAKGFEVDSTEGLIPLIAFLSNAALESGEKQSDPNQDAVQLMTLHAAKGLEFPVVFLCGLEEGLFPHIMSSQTVEDLEEERRLCYVGITRAMQHLYLSYAESRSMRGSTSFTRPSRFLGDIPKTLIEDIRLKTPIVKQNAFSPAPPRWENKNRFESYKSQIDQSITKPQAWVDPKASFRINQKVKHEKFGVGIVLANEGKNEQERVYIDFGKQGKKWLVLSYANLQLV